MHLLDVNLLIALCDADHVHHERARSWFRQSASAGWATCPLTENALLRIMGHPDYPGGPGSPAAVMPLLQQLRSHPGHVFLPDTISLADANLIPDPVGVSPKMLTDLYLLALAVANGCQLATLDKRIDPQLVIGGHTALVQLGKSDTFS
jgi:toxin-antitoxin system PIN domain toxin